VDGEASGLAAHPRSGATSKLVAAIVVAIERGLAARLESQKEGNMETKILLRNRNTKAYLGENENWTQSATQARNFETPYHALYFAVSKELEDIDIMFRLPSQEEVRFLKC
jgi:hypothetical protein